MTMKFCFINYNFISSKLIIYLRLEKIKNNLKVDFSENKYNNNFRVAQLEQYTHNVLVQVRTWRAHHFNYLKILLISIKVFTIIV